MKNNLPYYYRTWFISILFLAAPFTLYISAVAAICLLARSRDEFPMLDQEEIEKIKQQASDIISDAEKQKKEVQLEYKKIKAEISEMNTALSDKADEVLFSQTTVDFTDEVTSNEIKSELSVVQLEEKEIIKNNEAVLITSRNKKVIANKQAKQLLRAFNAEADYYISNVTMKNVDTFRNKLAKSFENLNKLFEIDKVQLTQKYLKSKLKQLDIIFKYKKQVEIEKELLKAQKEEIREQQKAEKEIQQAKAKLEKEERQFNNEMSKLLKYLNGAQNEIEQQIYADKIKELEDKIKELERDKEDVLKRESNTRAGYVYIISNIGSFGENVYKIGMTRRLEPMDRVNELSSASVPFPFDVHALIFSEDAPALESTLHNYFRNKEVNKVNPRKEFFKVDLQEIKEVVLKEHNNTVHFTDLAVAEQYYESIKKDVVI
ncbi:TPA: DUF4041 domain-containing protein [Streptococcus pyogenes]|uniref:DUF4041 domain-containing protein n=1 Tax=Streptococcus pyogenes TaxID=1314 RepID=UPI00109D2667|nr:DUF4041 domain-containing protein [Streptococcus pyogenes]VHF31232.1 phage membrane protein [Streptococcus pyogenes]VHG59261.1 phage membrane protein [Streptococcus pyogenes]VHG63512.1 phage membrane protein [Streptococcus pyogenes]VHM06057.1 phage membrane protein [Streptococcus pyogenes]VHM31495.1 phage membrane protein [Streptococcus pyogenes]